MAAHGRAIMTGDQIFVRVVSSGDPQKNNDDESAEGLSRRMLLFRSFERFVTGKFLPVVDDINSSALLFLVVVSVTV
jgi:hypothetical protein